MIPVIKPDGSQWITLSDGCCLQWVEVKGKILLGSYITEDSSGDITIDPYKAYANEQDENLFYVQENYDMAEPVAHKHSEDAEAAAIDITEDTLFVILIPTGIEETPYANYNVTYDTMITLVSAKLRLPYEVADSGETITVTEINGRTVQAIMLPNGTLTKSQFSQVNNDITYIGNSFYAGDEIVFIF